MKLCDLLNRSYLFPNTIKEIDDFSGEEFENFLKHYFEINGYQTVRTDPSGDRGIDLKIIDINKDGNQTIIGVQAKRWKSKVGFEEITKILDGKRYHTCHTVILITTSDLTQQAKYTADDNNIAILNRNDVIRMIEDLKTNPKAKFKKYIKPINQTPIIENKKNSKQTNSSNKLFQLLTNYRTKKAKELKLYPIYLIFNNETINQIINILPLTFEQLKLIKGFGEKRINAYGKDIINIIKNYQNIT